MRPIAKQFVLAILVILVLLLALGALPSLLKSGDPYYMTAEPTDRTLTGENETALDVARDRYPAATDHLRVELEALEERNDYEHDHEFYLCENCGIRFEFGEAMDFGFECPQCGNQVEAMENTRLVDAMDQRIDALRAELNVTPDEAEA